jgi:hypothetical protein
MDSHSSQAD